jgi:uncharacterized membrane protein
VLTILITAPLLIGMLIAYLNFIKKTGQLDINDLFKGFEMYGKSLAVCLLYSVLVFLWFLLLVVPGIIKAISYSQAVYIVAENPNVEAIEAIRISTKMTNGYKLDIFIMFFSFIGWALLCALTLGVGYIWLAPYMNTTFTNMYLKLKEISIRNGVCSESEFAGHIS